MTFRCLTREHLDKCFHIFLQGFVVLYTSVHFLTESSRIDAWEDELDGHAGVRVPEEPIPCCFKPVEEIAHECGDSGVSVSDVHRHTAAFQCSVDHGWFHLSHPSAGDDGVNVALDMIVT